MAASAYISASYDSTRELVLDYHKKAVDRLGDGRRSAQRMWRERAPLPPALGRVFKHRLFQIFCLTTLFLVVCMMPMLWVRPLQHGERKISSREWQVRDLSKHVENMRDVKILVTFLSNAGFGGCDTPTSKRWRHLLTCRATYWKHGHEGMLIISSGDAFPCR